MFVQAVSSRIRNRTLMLGLLPFGVAPFAISVAKLLPIPMPNMATIQWEEAPSDAGPLPIRVHLVNFQISLDGRISPLGEAKVITNFEIPTASIHERWIAFEDYGFLIPASGRRLENTSTTYWNPIVGDIAWPGAQGDEVQISGNGEFIARFHWEKLGLTKTASVFSPDGHHISTISLPDNRSDVYVDDEGRLVFG